MVKLRIFNDSFQQILRCLHCSGMINLGIISFKQDEIFSTQPEENRRAIRFFSYKHKCSMGIDSVESIEVDIPLLINLTRHILDDAILNIETDGEILSIDDGNHEIKIAYRIPREEEVDIGFTFELKDGVPLVGKSKILLDAGFTMLKSDLMIAVEDNNILKTEFFRFKLHDGKLILQVGDLEMFGNTKTSCFSAYDCNGNAKVTLVYGISQIAKTFGEYIHVNTRDDAPAWFHEKTDDYFFGVLVMPYIKRDEE